MNKRDSIRIELTSEQQQQIEAFSGHQITALELDGQELEQRIAPTSAPSISEITVSKPIDVSTPNLFR